MHTTPVPVEANTSSISRRLPSLEEAKVADTGRTSATLGRLLDALAAGDDPELDDVSARFMNLRSTRTLGRVVPDVRPSRTAVYSHGLEYLSTEDRSRQSAGNAPSRVRSGKGQRSMWPLLTAAFGHLETRSVTGVGVNCILTREGTATASTWPGYI